VAAALPRSFLHLAQHYSAAHSIFLLTHKARRVKKIKELHGQHFTSSKKPTHKAEAALT
jgi:hypothetical protein